MFSKFTHTASKSLKVIIVGCGKVGHTLTEQLSKEGNNITVIEKNPTVVGDIDAQFDIITIHGNGASYSTLQEAGVEDCDLFIAVTGSDELNLLCCTIAKQFSKCAAIARVRTPDYSKEVGYLRDKLGLAMIINPELESAREMARILYLPTALQVSTFAHGQAEMIKFKIPEGNTLDNMTIANLGKHITHNILICGVERAGEVFIPSGAFTLKADDVVYFASKREEARKFLKNIGMFTKQVRNAMIVGGGLSAYYLANELLHTGIDVHILETSFERCNELSMLLPQAVVINSDATSQEGLLGAGIKDMEAFVPLTGIDEENILLTLFAKKVSKAKVITKVNRIHFTDVISDLDLGSVVYPKLITSEAIIAYARALRASRSSEIETLYHIFDSRAEAIEFKIKESSPVVGKELKDLSLKKDLLIAFINRKGKIIIPSGSDMIEVGDSVMIVTTHTGLNEIRDILK
ncbi:MAG: Trk system potassium transporter TrkA [Clostridiales bacterium]|nr:Trk system potassium transporter TrkA [Clostridiales bacterium]